MIQNFDSKVYKNYRMDTFGFLPGTSTKKFSFLVYVLKLHISTFILVRKIKYIQSTTLQFKMQHFRSQRFYSTFTNVFAFFCTFPILGVIP